MTVLNITMYYAPTIKNDPLLMIKIPILKVLSTSSTRKGSTDRPLLKTQRPDWEPSWYFFFFKRNENLHLDFNYVSLLKNKNKLYINSKLWVDSKFAIIDGGRKLE